MKRKFLLLLCTAMAVYLPCCISCADPSREDDPIEDPGSDPKPGDENPSDAVKPQPGTYTFTCSALKGTWSAGDRIYVYGSYGPAAQVITLAASDISADGKTAGVSLSGQLFDYPLDPDGLYAAYPADAVRPGDGLMGTVLSFEKFDIPLSVAYLKDSGFAFEDISTGFTFRVSGGYDRFALAGARRPGLRMTGYSADYSSDFADFSGRKTDGYPFLEGELSDGSVLLWIPGTITLKEGLSLYLGKDGQWPSIYTASGDVRLVSGSVKDLGDITASLVPYSGPAPKMPEMGGSTKYDFKLNELSGLCVDLSGDFLWGLGDGGEIAKISSDGKLISKAGLRTTKGSSIDSEGLSINYDTGDILIGGEPNVVCRIPAASIGDIFSSSTFKGVESLFNIEDAKSFSNSGAEGCTYYKDGMVYIGTQTGSYLYLINLETGEVIWRKGLREKFSVITEIAGLCYDPLTDWLWVIDSESHRFFALTGDAEQLLGSYTLKTRSNEESICVDHKNQCIWVGDDYGSTSYLYRYDFTGLDDAVIE